MEVNGKIEIPIMVYNEMKDAVKRDDEKIVELTKKIATLQSEKQALSEALDNVRNASILERLFKWGKITNWEKSD